MEWDPTPNKRGGALGQDAWLRTQRFFPREQPTGLEGVWDSALRLDDRVGKREESNGGGGRSGWWRWGKS